MEEGKKATQYTQPTNMAPLKPYGAYAIQCISNIKHVNGNHTHIEEIIQFDDVAVATFLLFPAQRTTCVFVCRAL